MKRLVNTIYIQIFLGKNFIFSCLVQFHMFFQFNNILNRTLSSDRMMNCTISKRTLEMTQTKLAILDYTSRWSPASGGRGKVWIGPFEFKT